MSRLFKKKETPNTKRTFLCGSDLVLKRKTMTLLIVAGAAVLIVILLAILSSFIFAVYPAAAICTRTETIYTHANVTLTYTTTYSTQGTCSMP